MKRRTSLFSILLLQAATVAVVVLFAWTHALTQSEQSGWSQDLLSLKELDAQLDRDTLRVSSFLLDQYDPLSVTAERLRDLSQGLRDPSLGRYGTTTVAIDHAIDAYWVALEDKLDLVERIKLQAALVRNGLGYLPLAVEELAASGESSAGRVSTLLNRLYLLNLFPSETDERAIRDALAELDEQAAEGPGDKASLENILLHMRANLTGLLELGRLRADYVAVPSNARFERLHDLYDDHHAQIIRRVSRLSMGLVALTLLLLIGLALLLSRLDRARALAERERNRLVDAVESLGEAFALFDAAGRLVLCNRRFGEFYPWLKGKLESATERARLEGEHEGRLRRLPAPDAAQASPSEQAFLEQLDDGRWYLAHDSLTGEGGLACVRVDISETKRTELELRKLSQALEQSPASVVITDTQGKIEYVNPRFEEVTGYCAEEVLGRSPSLLKSGDKSPSEYRELWETITAGRVWRGQFHNKRKDGSIFWEAASISPVRDETGRVTHFVAVKEDITARKRAEEQLRMNATVFETTTEGIMVTDAERRIKTVNPAFTRITGYGAGEVIGKNPRLLSSGRHDAEFYCQLWEQLLRRGYWSGEIWDRRKDGSVFPAWMSLVALKDEGDQLIEFVAVFSDMTQRKNDEEQIRYQANHDALTGLPNRTLLLDRLELAIATAHRERREVALLFLDLDRFKSVNDTLGHVVGDELLQQVAGRVNGCTREADTVARFGGDEFAVLLPEVLGGGDVALVAEKIIARLAPPFRLAERELYIGASIGIALYPDDSQDADTMLLHADMAMYRAKEAGRNRYRFFTAGMQASIKAKAELEQELRLALERDELILHYQPLVEATTRRPVAYEALIRWRHPTRGLVPPDHFIPLAEEAGLVEPLGRWVLETACGQLRQWQQAGWPELRMAVNVSARQRQLGFSADALKPILAATGIAPQTLVLEITEGLMLDDSDESLAWLYRFRDLGVRLAIDDFGTGYSSLSYLKRFPVDELKIDRTFVRELPDNSDDASLVEAIIAMAHSLGLKLVAEGVETEEQCAFLRERGCGSLQGYLFGPPAPGETSGRLLERPWSGRIEARESGSR